MRANARSAALTSLLSCAVLLLPKSVVAERRELRIEDFDRMQVVGNPVCSRDGQWVAYTVEATDLDADERRRAVFMASFDGAQRIRLTAAGTSASNLRFSPDGRYVAYLATQASEEPEQLYLLDRRGGAPQALTHVTGKIADYDWSPDGHRIVLALSQGEPKEAPGGAAKSKAPRPIVIDELHFKQDRDGYLTAADRTQLYLLDVADGHLEPLTQGSRYDDSQPVWSPDGGRIAFFGNRRTDPSRSGKRELYLIEPRRGAEPRLVTELYAPNRQALRFTPDGRRVVVSVGLEPRLNAYILDRLALIDLSTGTSTELAPGIDRALSNPTVISNEALVALVEDDRGELPVRIPLAGGPIERLIEGKRSITDLCADGAHLAVVASTDTSPPEISALEGGALRPLSAHNESLMSELELGAVEDIEFPSRDGTSVHGVVVRPVRYVPGRAYPTILWIHGGPNGQDAHALSFESYSPELERQWFAAHGYLVLGVNYRGSSGRGAAFARAILADWGGKEVADLRAAVDFVLREKWADPARLGIGGWSYGGILTDYTIAQDTRFRAAIAGAGSADQIAMYGSDQYIMQYNAELGPPWRSRDLWVRLSYPFFHADRIRTPTLFLGGEKDFNVPIGGGEQMYEALRTLEVPTQLVIYPGQSHVFTRPSYIRDKMQRFVDWFARYLGPAGAR